MENETENPNDRAFGPPLIAFHDVPPQPGQQQPVRRMLPHNQDAELAVVGAVLFGGRQAWNMVSAVLRSEDFYDPILGAIFAACAACEQAEVPIDMLTVASRLRELKTIEKLRYVGGDLYLVELANNAGTYENIAAHAQLVVDAAMSRQVVFATGAIAEQAYAGVRGLELLEAAQARLFELGSRYQGLREPKPFKELLHRGILRLEQRYDAKTAITGVPTGFRDLDQMTGGLQSGNVVIICGRPGHGKSALAMQIGLHASVEALIPVLVFHLEMTEDEVTDRAISTSAQVPGPALRTGYITSQQWIAISKTVSRLAMGPMWIDDSVPLSLAALSAKARRWRSNTRWFPVGQPPRGLVIIDYMQLIKAAGSRNRNREQDVSELSHGVKALAKELQVPIIGVCSLSRKCEERQDKRPISSDLRESGDLESDASIIAAVYRDEEYDPQSPDRGIAEVILRKHRGGPTGTVRLSFTGAITRFSDLEPDQN